MPTWATLHARCRARGARSRARTAACGARRSWRVNNTSTSFIRPGDGGHEEAGRHVEWSRVRAVTRTDSAAQKVHSEPEVGERSLVCPLAVPRRLWRGIMRSGAARGHEETVGAAGQLSRNPQR